MNIFSIGDLDPAGMLGALATMVLATSTPFPAEIAAIAVAMKHGFWLGFALIWTGAMLGALLLYALALHLCRYAGWITRSRPVREAQARMHDLGWISIFGLRLIPLVPFFALSLAAGLIRMPLRAYVQGTALGILPASAVLSLFGQGLISGEAGLVTITVLAAAALAVMLWLFTRGRRRAASRRPPAGPAAMPAARPPQ